MSTWQITQKAAYLNDFIELNKNLQKAVVNAVEELEHDPVTPRGDTIKKLQGYKNVWRYRIGTFRLIYAVDRDSCMLRLLAVGPRGSIYERFNYRGWDAPGAAVEFGPRMEQAPEWSNHPEWFRPEQREPERERLPRKLTPALLRKWRIDERHHPALMRCLYAEDLLNLVNIGVPSDVLGRVMDGLFPLPVDKIASQPDHVLLDPEDLLAYAEGTLSAFLLHLDEKQKPLADWALAGPTLVKGGPGSGKSTVALYRIRAIVEQALRDGREVPSILFTTYTNALINSSESLLRQLLRDTLQLQEGDRLPGQIRITTLHKTATWIVRTRGEPFGMAYDNHRSDALQSARYNLRPRAFGDTDKLAWSEALEGLRDDYLLDEFDWVIEGQHCRCEQDYLDARRIGRGIPFPEARRRAVWRLYEGYCDYLRAENRYTWERLLQTALDHVRADDGFAQRWDYVIVDEAQDLPPVGVALCVELAQNPSGVFLTADANQSLYNRGFRWTYVHEDLNVRGRSRLLRRNYRSTQEIAAAAAQILQAGEEFDTDAAAQEFVHSGAYPVTYAASSSEDQARWIARRIYEAARELRLPPNAAAVLVSSSSVGVPLAAALEGHGLPTTFMKSRNFDLDAPCVKVTTLHAAKGLEFPIVVVAHVEAGRLPRDTDATDEEEIMAFLQGERRLFYVGCTRAMRYLFITYDRHLPSPFLADLGEDCWMMVGD